MTIASVADVKARLSAYVRASGKGPVVITRNGKAVAALVGLADDDDVERFLLGHSPRLRAILATARRRVRSGRGIRHADFWRGSTAAATRKPRRRAK